MILWIFLALLVGVAAGTLGMMHILAVRLRENPIDYLHNMYSRKLAGKTITFGRWPGNQVPKASPSFPPCPECRKAMWPCTACNDDHCLDCDNNYEHIY